MIGQLVAKGRNPNPFNAHVAGSAILKQRNNIKRIDLNEKKKKKKKKNRKENINPAVKSEIFNNLC